MLLHINWSVPHAVGHMDGDQVILQHVLACDIEAYSSRLWLLASPWAMVGSGSRSLYFWHPVWGTNGNREPSSGLRAAQIQRTCHRRRTASSRTQACTHIHREQQRSGFGTLSQPPANTSITKCVRDIVHQVSGFRRCHRRRATGICSQTTC